MIQFECPRVIYSLLLFNIGVHCGVSILLYAGKGICCIWPVNTVEIHFAKMGFMDCNLNAPGSYAHWSHSRLGYIVGCPFLWRKRGMLQCGWGKKWKLILPFSIFDRNSWTRAVAPPPKKQINS